MPSKNNKIGLLYLFVALISTNWVHSQCDLFYTKLLSINDFTPHSILATLGTDAGELVSIGTTDDNINGDLFLIVLDSNGTKKNTKLFNLDLTGSGFGNFVVNQEGPLSHSHIIEKDGNYIISVSVKDLTTAHENILVIISTDTGEVVWSSIIKDILL